MFNFFSVSHSMLRFYVFLTKLSPPSQEFTHTRARGGQTWQISHHPKSEEKIPKSLQIFRKTGYSPPIVRLLPPYS